MRGLLKFAWMPVLAVSAMAAPFSLSTGSAAWNVTQTAINTPNSGNGFNTPSAAIVLTGQTPANSFGNPWVAAPGGSAWVGQKANDGNVLGFGCSDTGALTGCGAVAGTYVYTLTFAAGLGGSLNFSFASDNYVSSLTITDSTGTTTLYSNGGGTSNQGSLTALASNYAANGNVTITATVVNSALSQNPSDRNPSGFLLSGTGNSNDAPGVPEPSTYAMLGLGMAALAAARMRRK